MIRAWIVVVVLAVLFGGLGNAFAKRTGRNQAAWTMLGATLNFVLFAVLLLKKDVDWEKFFGRRGK